MNPQTYNDDRIEELSRRVYFTALTKAQAEMDRDSGGNPERIHALAALADAAASGFTAEDDAEEDF